MNDLPQTLIEAVRYFSDRDLCNRYMKRIKWPNGVTCPHCESDRIGEVATRGLLRCKDCRKSFSYKIDTIFEDSPLGLDKWFVAVWCIANAKNGISSHELGRALGITQKSAWFMLHRIREAMRTGSFRKLAGHAKTYVRGRVHTNGMENFWSLLKRALGGTYVAVAPFHLFRYIDEQAYRFNKRLGSDASRFYEVLLNVVGKRLTWRKLTAQEDAGFMGIT
jgi:transposase-like protein